MRLRILRVLDAAGSVRRSEKAVVFSREFRIWDYSEE